MASRATLSHSLCLVFSTKSWPLGDCLQRNPVSFVSTQYLHIWICGLAAKRPCACELISESRRTVCVGIIGVHGLRLIPMSHLRICRAILSRQNVAVCYYACRTLQLYRIHKNWPVWLVNFCLCDKVAMCNVHSCTCILWLCCATKSCDKTAGVASV